MRYVFFVFFSVILFNLSSCSSDSSPEVETNTKVAEHQNSKPVINNQIFTVAENITDNTIIGIVVAKDKDNDELTFRISKDEDSLFKITNTGELSLLAGKFLDFETKTTHQITITVFDGVINNDAVITINVTDIKEITAFITKWKTEPNDKEIEIGTHSELTYDYHVDWGDSTSSKNLTGNAKHTYKKSGIYTVTITGKFPGIRNRFIGDEKLIAVVAWGTQKWETMKEAFARATNLVIEAKDIPDLSNVTSLHRMFDNATNFNADLSKWDVSNVTDMTSMFVSAKSFNGDISTWDVSKVTDLRNMFFHAFNFNGDITQWDVSSVKTFNGMFFGAKSFQQDLSNWDVRSAVKVSCGFFNSGGILLKEHYPPFPPKCEFGK